MSHQSRHGSSAGHCEPEAVPYPKQTRHIPCQLPPDPCWARVPLGFSSCILLFPSLRAGLSLLKQEGAGGALSVLFSAPQPRFPLSLQVCGQTDLPAKVNRSSFLCQGHTGMVAPAQGPALLCHSVLLWGEKIHPSLFCLCGRDSSHGTEVPQHRPWEKVDLKTVVGDCLNISPFFFIRLRGFAVSVTPLRDRSSSLFGCEYLTSF